VKAIDKAKAVQNDQNNNILGNLFKFAYFYQLNLLIELCKLILNIDVENYISKYDYKINDEKFQQIYLSRSKSRGSSRTSSEALPNCFTIEKPNKKDTSNLQFSKVFLF
jgi:hypothetical protein